MFGMLLYLNGKCCKLNLNISEHFCKYVVGIQINLFRKTAGEQGLNLSTFWAGRVKKNPNDETAHVQDLEQTFQMQIRGNYCTRNK